MHYAYLAFAIVGQNRQADLVVGFEPYVLQYHQRHRNDFSAWINRLRLHDLGHHVSMLTDDHKAIAESMKRQGARMTSEFIPGINPSPSELAQLVIAFTAMFPFLDVFTKLSNGEDISGSQYVQQFNTW